MKSNRRAKSTEVCCWLSDPAPISVFVLLKTCFTSEICLRLGERYYATIELDEQFVEARASLGCLLVEMGKSELAISAFQGALDHHA